MRLSLALLGLGAFAIAGSGPANGAPAGAARAASFARVLDAELSAITRDPTHSLASLSVLAIRDGQVVYHRQFGHRFIDARNPANSKPATAATLYRVASISKLVVTLGVLRMVEDGTLALDADIGRYLGYPVRNPHFPDVPITLRMLLTHTSSLRDEAGYFWPDTVDLKDVLAPEGRLHSNGVMWSARAKPGEFFEYANLPWGVVGSVVEKATGERFDRVMSRLIVAPLGLQGGFSPADLPPGRVRNIATLYRKRATVDGREIWNPRGPWVAQVDDYSAAPPVPRAGPGYVIGSNGTLFGPQGNLRASAADLGRIMLMLMNGGELDGKRIVRTETLEAMFAQQWRNDNGKNGNTCDGTRKDRFQSWGLGNQRFLDVTGPGCGDRLVEGGGFTGVGHVGDAWGLTGAFVFDRNAKNGIIFLTGGPAFDPETYKGRYSSFYRHEELILTALHRRALLQRLD